MRIEQFNALPSAEAEALVRACSDVPRWAAEIAAGRPYRDSAALLAAAESAAVSWSDDEVTAALADHPRLGERHGGNSLGAAHSAREQSSLGADDDVRRRLAEGNLAYERRFGRVFLIRAAGRDAQTILALLERRMDNDPATEREVTRSELGEIAVLRLADMIEQKR